MRDEGGFTLLEVMVALVIAAAALGVMFQSAGAGLQAVRAAGGYEEAISRARSHLAAVGREAGTLVGEAEGDDGGGYRWRLRVVPLAQSRRPENGLAPDGEAPPPLVLYSVEAAVSWQDGKQKREVTLRTERVAPGRSP